MCSVIVADKRATVTANPIGLVVCINGVVQLSICDFTRSYGDTSLCFLSYSAI